MKIAVSAQGEDLSSLLDPRFGRAKWFILYDTDAERHEVLENVQIAGLPQGAGIQAAQQMIDRNADVVVTGNCGPNAFRTLTAAGLSVIVGASGTVKRAIEQVERGELSPSQGPNVQGHW